MPKWRVYLTYPVEYTRLSFVWDLDEWPHIHQWLIDRGPGDARYIRWCDNFEVRYGRPTTLPRAIDFPDKAEAALFVLFWSEIVRSTEELA